MLPVEGFAPKLKSARKSAVETRTSARKTLEMRKPF
jgi:hypothetical protein